MQVPAGAATLARPAAAPFIAGRAQMSVSGPQWFIAGDTAEIGFRWNPGTFFGSIVWFDFRNLGANRNLVAWIELRVNPPGPTTFRIAGSGNPTSILVSNQGTGGQRLIVPLALKSGVGRAGHRLRHADRAGLRRRLVQHHSVRLLTGPCRVFRSWPKVLVGRFGRRER